MKNYTLIIKKETECFQKMGFQLDVNKSYENKIYNNPNEQYSLFIFNLRHHHIEMMYYYNTETSKFETQYNLWFNPRNGSNDFIPLNTSTNYNKFLHKVEKSIYYNKWKNVNSFTLNKK